MDSSERERTLPPSGRNTQTPMADGNESSSSSSSSSSSARSGGRSSSRTMRYELKKAAEKKFRHRYLLLQQAYEQRLQALAAQVRHVVAELQSDTTIEYLQQDPLTSEYANARVAEIIQECFLGEREKYIKVVSDQIAWQTNDLRDAKQRIRNLQKKEKNVHHKWKHAQSEIHQLQQQLERRAQEASDQQRTTTRLEELIMKLEQERDDQCVEIKRLNHTTTSLETLRHEYETFQVRVQNERDQERHVQEDLKMQVEHLREERDKLKIDRQGLTRDNDHLRQLVSIAEAKSDELTQSLRQVQAEEYSTRLLKMEHELAHQRHVNDALQKDNELLTKKYEEFGAQVEVYMDEQARERAAVAKQADERERKLTEEISVVKMQNVESLKVKQNELLRLADQIKFRQDALAKAEHKNAILEERINSLETTLNDEKLRSTKSASEQEKELTKWKLVAEQEKERGKLAEAALVETKQAYELKVASIQDIVDQQQQQSLKERELEAHSRWQNEFVAKQEARIESLKNKYDTALEAQQSELIRARQIAVEAAKSASQQVEEVKSFQKTQRDDDDEARRRRDDAREAERLRMEVEKTKDAAIRKQQKELEEKDKRVKELEHKLAEKDKQDERRREGEQQESAAAVREKMMSNNKKSETPSVVVVNVNGTDELDDHEDKIGARAIAMVRKRQAQQKKASATSGSRQPLRPNGYEQPSATGGGNNQEMSVHDDCVPIAQHKAELQAREAQIALDAEKRLQKEMHEFQERKERELRNAMVNVRKGIQKLETSLESEKNDKKRFENELFSERQAFVALKSELDESRDAKRTLTQRLEEANANIGRLRDVVKLTEQKATTSDERMKAAQTEKREAEQLTVSLKEELEIVKMKIKEMAQEETHLQLQLDTAKRSEQDLTRQLRVTAEELTLREKQFHEEKNTSSEFHANELARVSTELTARIRMLDGQLMEQNGETKQLQEKVEGGAKSMEQLTVERVTLERTLENSKTKMAKQRQDFNDLARMHKNLTETMNAKIQDDQSKYMELEAHYHALRRSHEATKHSHRKALEWCLVRVQQVKNECSELGKSSALEIKSAWKHTKKETQLHGKEIQRWMEKALEQEARSWDQAIRVEREEWRARLDGKEKDMSALLAGQKVDDQTKYNQLVNRLDAKTQELQDMERQTLSHVRRIEELQLMIRKLEQENETRLLEQSQLAEQLSSSRVTTDRETEANHHLQVSVAKVADVSQIFLNFVRQVMNEFALDPRKVLTVLDSDLKHPETWRNDQLANDLHRVMELLQERVATKERTAAEGAVRPVETELQAARDALAPLVVHLRGDISEGVARHLPWYVSVVRSVEQQMERLRVEADELRQAVGGKTSQVKDIQAAIEKLQQAQAVLLFEKETVTHEMNLQLQTLQKKRDADLQQQKEEHERKVEQIQRRHATDQLKAREEHELEVEQLKDALETEKKTLSKLKQESMMARVEHEKLLVDVQDRAAKLDKELEFVRDEMAKWKRKAKLSASKSPGTPSRRPSVMFNSSYHTEDGGGSEHSYQSMFPPSRRPSSAMADLSNLMEQSLHDLRKDYENVQMSPTLLLQSPMRRTPGGARPSPLRIPMHTSPARKRPSLVPPPRLINTATSQMMTPPPLSR